MADPDKPLHPRYRVPLSREGFDLDFALSGLECVSMLHQRVPDAQTTWEERTTHQAFYKNAGITRDR
jgi:hypothetical protein